MPDVDFNSLLNPLLEKSSQMNLLFEPHILRLQNEHDKQIFIDLFNQKNLNVIDTINNQLSELLSYRAPSKKFTAEELEKGIRSHLNNIPVDQYGVWVYYAWNNNLVHLLDKYEFLEVITNRNKQKITAIEQQTLLTKKIGIIGMSVGQSIASAIAIENLCSEIRIADFDLLELSNCNRIKTSLKNLGLNKTVIAAREISEINPFIKIVCYTNGVDEENIEAFFNHDGKLDLIIEECDSINIKLLARIIAKKNKVPVLMETNDRGMIDIERYDLENDYPYLHGLLNDVTYEQLKQLNNQEKIGYILKIAAAPTTSVRAKVSFLELGQTISSFPQLASSVFLGSALCAETARKILLNEPVSSGRFYVDIDQLISKNEKIDFFEPTTHSSVTIKEMEEIAATTANNDSEKITQSVAEKIISDAIQAPSSGNDQPWQWLYANNNFFLFHQLERSYSFGDFRNRASYISLGAAIENFVISAQHNLYNAHVDFFPTSNKSLVAKISLKTLNGPSETINNSLYNSVYKRHTNRKIIPRKEIPEQVINELTQAVESVQNAHVAWITSEKQLFEIGKIISACDRIRLLNPHGHYDFFHREIRWSDEELMLKRTGMSIRELEMSNDSIFALKLLSENKVVDALNRFNGGNALRYVSVQNTMAASAMGLITMPDYSPESFLEGGRAMQRQWLKATELAIAYHPMVAPLYLFPRIVFGEGEGLGDAEKSELNELRQQFIKIFPGYNLRGEIMLFRIFTPDDDISKAPRLNLNDVFIYNND